MQTPAALLLLAGLATAGPKAPECAPDSKTALEIARTRGKLIFLTVMVDHDGENRMVIDSVFRYKPFLKISREFVCVLANPEETHGKVAVQDKKTGKRVHRCADCPSIECYNHMELAQNWARAFFPMNEAKCPVHFVIDQNEEVIATIKNGDFETGLNHVEGKVVVAELQKLLKKYGRGLSDIEYEGMLKSLSAAKAARARGNITLELEKLALVVALDRKVVGVEQAKARVKELDAIAAKEIVKALALVDAKKWEEALARLEEVSKTYPGTLSAASAENKSKELMGLSAVKKLLKAKGYYEKGLAYAGAGKTDAARKKFEQCMKAGKDTRYEELARKALGELK